MNWSIECKIVTSVLCQTCESNYFGSHTALDLDFFALDDFSTINFEPVAELKVEKDNFKEKTYLRNRQALQQALIGAANIDIDLQKELQTFFWSVDSNEDARLCFNEFRKVVEVDHIDMDDPHVLGLVSSLFKVSKTFHFTHKILLIRC